MMNTTTITTQEGYYMPSVRKREAIALPDLKVVRTWQRFQTACLLFAGEGGNSIKISSNFKQSFT